MTSKNVVTLPVVRVERMEAPTMNVYEVRHDGHYLGGLSVVVAETEEQAIALTKEAIVGHGLKTEGITVARRLKTDLPHCYVLDNGDY